MGRPKKEVSQGNLERFNKELEMAGTHTELLLRDKKGRSRSCLLCKRRKQRCDHKQPSCTTCLKAAVKCVQPVRYNMPTGDTEGTPSPLPGAYSGSNTSNVAQTPKAQKNGIISPDSGATSNVTSRATSRAASGVASGSVVNVNSGAASGASIGAMNGGASMPSSLSSGHSTAASPELRSPSLNSSTFNLYPADLGVLNKPLCGQGAKLNPAYTLSLERRVKYLESLLDTSVETLSNPTNSDKNANILPLPNTGIKGKFLPLKKPATNHGDSPLSIAANLAGPNQSTILPSLASDSLDSVEFLKCIFAKYNLREFLDYDPAFRFEEEVSRSLLETFFCRLQFKYPLLDEDEIYTFHDDYIHSNIYSYSENGFHFACGRLWLVFSISACLSMTTGKYKGEPPVRYFSRAIRHITRCGENLTHVQQVELLTLLVLYILRTDRDSLVLYDIIRDAMIICRDKLHLNVWRPEDPMAHKNLRLFWCVYLLERMICVAVGRPYAIAESEIDLPLFDEVSFNTRTMNDPKRQHKGVHFINQSLRLRRIESHFVEKLQILPESQNKKQALSEQLPLVQKFFHELEVWRANCSKSNVRNFENETLKLYYYRSVRLLIQPYLEFLEPEDRLFRECQAAAGQICQLFKIFHQKTMTGHSTPAVHTVFIAGVTLIYCMWLARNNNDQKRKNLGDESKHTRPLVSASLFSTMDDLRACSVCLYVMTERSSFARIFRDTFDQLMNATVGNLIERCGPNSSELIYISSLAKGTTDTNKGEGSNARGIEQSEGGMPPATRRIYGTRQAEVLAGFVENSQVDLEKQKELKKKQGVLEQKSVPESLSHFLINRSDKSSSQESSSQEITESESTEKTATAKKRRGSRCDNDSLASDENQYIVKKPTHSKEYDWKVFQHQALLQQHNAQQNLQAYLSSLNGNNKAEQRLDGIKTCINDIEKRFAHTIGPSNGYILSEIKNAGNNTNPVDFGRLTGPVGPPGAPGAPGSSRLSGPPGPQNSALPPMLNPEQNYRVLGANSTREGFAISTSKPVAKLLARKEPENSATILNANILLSNGAQDMINDISTWTTDSVAHLMNDNNYKRDASYEDSNNAVQTQSSEAHRFAENFHSSTEEISSSGSKKRSMEPTTSYPQSTSLGFLPVSNNGSIPVTSATDADQIKLSVDPEFQSVKLPPPTAKDFVVEEFWTVNDDYGFLT